MSVHAFAELFLDLSRLHIKKWGCGDHFLLWFHFLNGNTIIMAHLLCISI